jgi:hypothetical protein
LSVRFRGIFTALLFFVFVLSGAWGCHGKSSGTQAIQYPAGWPVPAFTVPPGGVQCHKPLPPMVPGQGDWVVSGVDSRIGTPLHSRMWELYFTYNGTWDQVITHLDGCLAHSGWRFKDHSLNNSGGLDGYDHFYISPDYLTVARILLMDNTYYLSITLHDNEISQYPVATASQPLP